MGRSPSHRHDSGIGDRNRGCGLNVIQRGDMSAVQDLEQRRGDGGQGEGYTAVAQVATCCGQENDRYRLWRRGTSQVEQDVAWPKGESCVQCRPTRLQGVRIQCTSDPDDADTRDDLQSGPGVATHGGPAQSVRGINHRWLRVGT
jgi:hypothetical protein